MGSIPRVRLKAGNRPNKTTNKSSRRVKRPQLSNTAKARLNSKKQPTIMDTCVNPDIFGPWFKDHKTWLPWFAFLRTLFGLPMRKEHKQIFEFCTHRSKVPKKAYEEAWLIVGRRGGKSRVLALVAVYLAIFRDWRPYLSPGERAMVIVVARDRKQARVIFRYIEAFLKEVEVFDGFIERDTSEIFELRNRVSIEVQTASFRSVRGYTIIAALLDEVAFFQSEESLNPDHEIIKALRPGRATVPGAMLLCASSPYARRGAMWEAYEDYFGKDDDEILVWKSSTDVMNPSIDRKFLEKEYKKDPSSARAEYGAEFRTDVEAFINKEIIDACTAVNTHELSPSSSNEYFAFVDPSGGSRDSMTLAISHYDETNDKTVLDCIREVIPPFSPDGVTEEFANVMRQYGCYECHGDRYAGLWPTERFLAHGIMYKPSEKTKSEIYMTVLPELNAHHVLLLDLERIMVQFCGLERKTSRAGRDSVDHSPGGRDDVVNAAAGSLLLAMEYGRVKIELKDSVLVPLTMSGPGPYSLFDEL